VTDSEFVEVYRAANGIEAHLLKASLEEAGIPTRVTDEAVATLEVNMWFAAPRLWVAKANAAKAADIIRAIETARETRPRPGNAD